MHVQSSPTDYGVGEQTSLSKLQSHYPTRTECIQAFVSQLGRCPLSYSSVSIGSYANPKVHEAHHHTLQYEAEWEPNLNK